MRKISLVSAAIASLLLYVLTKTFLSPFVRKVYQFDTNNMFFGVFFGLLFVAVALMNVTSQQRKWQLVRLGSVAGLLAGLAAQTVILWMERYRFEDWSFPLLWEVIGSFLLMSAVLATPIWGVVVVALASVIFKGCHRLSKDCR